MNCKKPFVKGLEPFPCGQCLPCRINLRRLWTHRILLESKCHARSIFVTLTYSSDHVPSDGSLQPEHVRDFLKRFRKAISPARVRFFAVGEYGDRTFRPHYHLVLFGVGLDSLGDLQKCWAFGFVDIRELSPELAQYCAGYTTKKLTRKDDIRLGGRSPEFARMSLKPGIGALAVPSIVDALTTYHGASELVATGDAPSVLRHGKKLLPLGRYLRRKVRQELDFSDVSGQTSTVRQNHLAELQALRDLSETRFQYLVSQPFTDHQKILQIEGKYDLYRKRSKL